MKKLSSVVLFGLLLASCGDNLNDADGRNASDTTNGGTVDTTRMMTDSSTSGMDTARESYDQNNGK